MSTPELVRKFASFSKGGVEHEVTKVLNKDGKTHQYQCSCEGFHYRQKCWHLDVVLKELAKQRGFT